MKKFLISVFTALSIFAAAPVYAQPVECITVEQVVEANKATHNAMPSEVITHKGTIDDLTEKLFGFSHPDLNKLIVYFRPVVEGVVQDVVILGGFIDGCFTGFIPVEVKAWQTARGEKNVNG